MPDPETPESVVAQIEAIPEGERTKDQRRALNRARHAIARIEAGFGPDTRPAALPPVAVPVPAREAEPVEGKTETPTAPASDTPPAFVDEPCPDPLDPQASRHLYAAFYRRLWALAHSARATNMDVISGFSAAKGAAGVGKEAPPPEARHLDMASILGNGVGPTDEEGA